MISQAQGASPVFGAVWLSISRQAVLAGFTIVASLVGLRLPAAHAAGAKVATKPFTVEVRENVTYYEGLAADRPKHQLDLYFPGGVKNYPVFFFVHGGGWTIGDKKGDLGVYQILARSIARRGIGVVVPNYRLSPGVMHPGHIQDVARAFAWTVKHIAEHGGRPDAIFIGGHSAGGHLVALLAVDPSYLKAENLTVKAIRGVIPISGVYQLPGQGILDGAFGRDPLVRKLASPVCHVCPALPPFLILFAERDLSSCGKRASETFGSALLEKHNNVCLMEIKGRNHISIVFNMVLEDDPAREAILTFIRKNTPQSKTH